MSVAAAQSYANRAGGAIAHKSPSLTWRYDCGYGGADKTKSPAKPAPAKPRHLTGASEMISSRDRILTTHVGSLPRNEKLSDLLMAQEEGKSFDPKVLTAEMDSAVRHVVKAQMDAGIDVGNDGEQRPDRLPDLCAAAHVRLCRRVEAPPRPGVRRVSRTAGLSDAALPEPDQEPAGRAGGAGRHQVCGPQADHRRDRALQPDRRRTRRVLRAVHDRSLARHHLDDDAQRLLRLARRLSRCDRPRDEQGIPGGAQGRPRCCRSTRRISRWTAR